MTRRRGFALAEALVVIVLLGILASIATHTMTESMATAKYEHTKKELEQLALAIVGDPSVYVAGARSDFGYVGDVGALPPDLDALVTNPGGYSTWHGPYISRNFDSDDFKKDAWGVLYVYSDTLLRSTGSGSNIDKIIASSTADLLANSIEGCVVDASGDVPGPVYRDSLQLELVYPEGSGGLATASTNPTATGNFSFSGIPIGNHSLRLIYLPDSDTTTYTVSVMPGRTVKLDLGFPADLW